MKIKLDYFTQLCKNKLWNRRYFLLLFLVPVPVLILPFSIFYRLPCITEATEEISHFFQMRAEIEREKIDTSDKETKIAMNAWKSVRKKVPDSYEAVSNLIIDLDRFLASRGFAMNYTLGELKPDFNGVTGLSLLPINLKLKVKRIDTKQNGSVPVGLPRFVELLHDIVKSHYGVELSDVVVKGTGEGISTMDVSINLWVGFGSELHSINEV